MSFCAWNETVAKQQDKANMDPNYTLATQFAASPWNQCLNRFQQKISYGADLPTFHIDIHGKWDITPTLEIGTDAMMEVFGDERFVQKVIDAFEKEMGYVLHWLNATRGFEFEVDTDPNLRGFWGHDTFTTMNHQSVLLGMPAVQFEMPPDMRLELIQNPEFMRRFAAGIVGAYKRIYNLDEALWEQLFEKSIAVSPPSDTLIRGYDEYLEFVATVDKKIKRF